MEEHFDVTCEIPRDAEHFKEIQCLTKNEKTTLFLIGLNAWMTFLKNQINHENKENKENKEEELKKYYENEIIRTKETTKDIYNDFLLQKEKEFKEKYEKKQQCLEKTNQELKETINTLEKNIIEINFSLNHNKELTKTTLELELQKKINELERQFKDVLDEKIKEINEENKTNMDELLKQFEKTKEEKCFFEKELENRNETILHNKELNKNIIEIEINNKIKQKETFFENLLNEHKKKINELEKQIIESNHNISKKELEKNILLQTEISILQNELNATKERLNVVLFEKNTQEIEMLKRKVQETDKTKSGCKGSIGEKYFYDLVCETFASYDAFDIKTNAKNISHSGDHFLIFKNYTILTDTKNFEESSGVSTTDIKKLNRDMKQNSQIKIAWLVSLDKPILKHAEHPYTIEIDQENGICFVYINSLMKNENPKQLLELVWYNCDLIYKYVLQNETDLDLLNKYKRKEEQIRVILEKLKKQSKERMAMINQLKDNFLETEKSLLEACNNQILDIRNIHGELLEKWWNDNLEPFVGDMNIKSNAIYDKFTLTNSGNGITKDIFKNLLKGLLNADDIIIGKGQKTQYKIINYKWKM